MEVYLFQLVSGTKFKQSISSLLTRTFVKDFIEVELLADEKVNAGTLH